MSILENITLQMNLDDRNFEREFKSATNVVSKQMDTLTLGASAFEAKWADITSNLRSVKRVASGLAISAAIYAVTDAITGASSAILTFRNNLEASKISMEYFADASNQAKEYIRELEDFAAYTPFSTESAISMAQYLQAMSVPINSSKSVLKVISDTAAATGATEENMQRIVTALGQILTKGKLAAEEVRQLANANIPIYDILKEQLKLTGQEIKNLGKLNINASKAVVAILDGLNERYKGASEKIANTLGGMTETIKDDALIIGEAFFHGTLDRLEKRVTKIRDRLDEWRDIALHFGTGGMITSIIEDLDPTGKLNLEQYVLAAVAGFKNLGDTIKEFTTRNGNLLKTFAATGYSAIMSLTVAGDYLLRTFNMLQHAGESVVDIINKMTGMSLSLSDVVAGLLVFRTVGNTIMFAGNTALWAGKQFVTLGTSLASMIPIVSSAGVVTQGLTSGLITLALAAAAAYGGLKLIQGATGISGDSALVTDEYTKQMAEYNEALNQWQESLNQDYSSIADNWAAQMSDALDSTEKKAKKTAKKIEKTWLMSFDEVFQIREDPVTKGLDDKLEKFEDIDWGQFFTLPEFRFPKRLADELTQPAHSLTDAINTAQENVGVLNRLLPALIAGTGIIATVIKNRRDFLDKYNKEHPTGPDGGPSDDVLTDRELKAKLDKEFEQNNKYQDNLSKTINEYNSVIKDTNTIAREINDVDKKLSSINNRLQATQLKAVDDTDKLIIEELQANIAELTATRKTLVSQLPTESQRQQLIQRISTESKETKSLVEKIYRHQIRLGDTREVNTTGITAASGIVNIERLNRKLDDVYDKIVDFTNIQNEHSSILRKILKDPTAMPLMKKADTIQLRLKDMSKELSANISSIDNTISKLRTKGSTAGISMDKFYGLIEQFGRITEKRLSDLSSAISTQSYDTLALTLDTLDADAKVLKDYAAQFDELIIRHGIPVDKALTDNLMANARNVEAFGTRFKAYLSAFKDSKSLQEAAAAGGIIVRSQIDNLSDKLKFIAQDLSGYKEAVRTTQPEIRRAIERLEDLKAVNNELRNISARVGGSQASDVISLAREVKELAASNRWSSNTEIRRKFLIDEFNRLYSAMSQPNIAFRDDSSSLLREIKYYLIDHDIWDTFAPIDTALDTYTTRITRKIEDGFNKSVENGQEIIADLKELKLPGEKGQQLIGLEKEFDKLSKAMPDFEILNDIYHANMQQYKALDNFRTQLRALQTGITRSSYEYDVLQNLLDTSENYDAPDLYKALTSIAGESKEARVLVNRATSGYSSKIKNVFDSSKIEKYFAKDISRDNRLEAVLDRATAIAQNTEKGNKTLLDLGADNNKIKSAITKFEEHASALHIRSMDALYELQDAIEGTHKLQDIDGTVEYFKLSDYIKNIEANGFGSFDSVRLNLETAFGLEHSGKVLSSAGSLEDLKTMVGDIQDLLDEQQRIHKSIDNIYKKYTAEAAQAGIDKNSILQKLRTYKAAWDADLSLDTLEPKSKSNTPASKFKRLEDLAEVERLNVKDTTGAYRAALISESDAYAFKGATKDLGVLVNELAAAQANLRLGMYPKSITQLGVTAQGALQKVFVLGVSDEVATSTEQIIQRGASKAFSTRLRSVLKNEVFKGQVFNQGITAADATGQIGVKMSNIVQTSVGTYGLVQRILESTTQAKDILGVVRKSLDNYVTKPNLIEMPLDDFIKAYRGVAPDTVSKVVSDLVGSPKLDGVILSIFDSTAEKFKPLLDAARDFQNNLYGTDTEKISQVREQVASKMLGERVASNNIGGLDDSVYNEHLYNLLITANKEQLAEHKAYYTKQAALIKDAADVMTIAKANKIDISLDLTTLYGTKAITSTRYADLSTKSIKEIGDVWKEGLGYIEDKSTEFIEAANNIQGRLNTFSKYLRDITKYSLTHGDLNILRRELSDFREQLKLGTLAPTALTGIPGSTTGYDFALPTVSTDMQRIISTAFDAVDDILDKAVPAMLVTYNDMSSKILRVIDAVGVNSSDIGRVLEAHKDELNILEKTAEKLEHALELDNTVSSRWRSIADNFTPDLLTTTDPFRYLNLEESVGKMVNDLLNNANNKTLNELLLAVRKVNPEYLNVDIQQLEDLRKSFLAATEKAANISGTVNYVKPLTFTPYNGATDVSEAALNLEYITNAMKALGLSGKEAEKVVEEITSAVTESAKALPYTGSVAHDEIEYISDISLADKANTAAEKEARWNEWAARQTEKRANWDAYSDNLKAEKEARWNEWAARQDAKRANWDAYKAAHADDELRTRYFGASSGEYVGNIDIDTDEFSEFFKDFSKNFDDTYIDPAVQAREYIERITKSGGLTNNKWANLGLNGDEEVLKKLSSTMTDDEISKFTEATKEFYKGWDSDALNAAMRGDAFGEFATADEFGKAFEEHLKEAFGDSFDEFEEKVFAANNETLTKGPLAARAYADFANALQNNKFINKMLMPNELGITGIDAAVALQRTVEALSAGADESMAAAQRWQDINSKYAIQTLDRNGNVDTNGNMADLMDAATVGGWSLLIEGALTTAISSAVSGAVSGSATGPLGTVVGAGAGLAAALVASIGMALTGSFDIANIASEEIKEMLNNTDFAYAQAKQQGASDKEARDIQNKIARDLYLQYYNEMSSIWSMSDKASIAELTESKGSFGVRHNQTGTAAGATALRQAVAELTGNSTDLKHAGNNLVDASGNIQAMAYDAEKIYQQLYTLYTTGGMQNIEEYNNRSWFGKLKGGLTNLEEDWMYTIQDADDLTKARIDDMFKLEIDAAAYIKEQGEEKIKDLLTSFGLASDNMQQMIEGVITLYNSAVTQFSQTLEAKAAFINTGTVSQLTLGTLSAGEGSVGRLLSGDLSNVDTQYLDLLHDATGLYVGAVSDTMYSLTADISDIKEKMTGFTATFPSTITVGADEIEVQSILSDTKAVSILNGMGININADGTVTVSTEAINANESGHERSMAYSLSDVSAYELSELAKRGLNLNEAGADKVGITLDEAAMQAAIKGLTYNLTGIDLTSVSAAAVEALKAAGIALTQNQETGKTVATITDTSFITGSKTISELLAGLDPDTFSRMSDNLTGALKGIDAINEFGAKHGESRIGSAAGIELDTGFTSKEYSAALEQAFSKAGVTLKAAVDSDGNEAVYAAINNVGEQWHKAITQWSASDITPEMKAFLEELGAEVYEAGSYTLVSTEGILDNLANGNKSRITEILFDNAEMWSQFPDDVKQAFIDAGLATEDGFITLDGEALDGWYRFQVGSQEAIAMAFSAMDADTYAAFAKMQGTTVKSYESLTNENKYWLGQLGITSEEEYNKNADSLVLLATNKMGLLKDGVMLKWSELSVSQRVALLNMGISDEEQYNANMDMLKIASENGMDILHEDTVLSWDQLSQTALDKLSNMGITTEDQYNKYLADMDVKTGQGFNTIDDTTEQKLAELGVTTNNGWGAIKQVTDTTLSEAEHVALGHMKFEDLPATVQAALGKDGVYGDLHDAWFAINTDATSALGTFSDTVGGMAADLDRVKELAKQLKQALADPGLQAESLNANLASMAATALEAAKSGNDKWAEMGIGTFGKSYSYGKSDSKEWSNWSNKTQITGQLVAINEDKLDQAGNPMVYYIYNLDVNGQPGQIIRNADGVWRKYLGTTDYSADNVPQFKLGGMVTGDGLFRAGEFGLNEAIVPLEQPQAMHRIGSALAAAIPAYELVAPLKSMLGLRDGGVAQFSSFQREDSSDLVERIANKLLESQAHTAPQPSYMSNNDDKRPLYVGTLIADKAGLRELDRQMKRVVRQDGGR